MNQLPSKNILPQGCKVSEPWRKPVNCLLVWDCNQEKVTTCSRTSSHHISWLTDRVCRDRDDPRASELHIAQAAVPGQNCNCSQCSVAVETDTGHSRFMRQQQIVRSTPPFMQPSKACMAGPDWLNLAASRLTGQQLSPSLVAETGWVLIRVIHDCEASRPAVSHHCVPPLPLFWVHTPLTSPCIHLKATQLPFLSEKDTWF